MSVKEVEKKLEPMEELPEDFLFDDKTVAESEPEIDPTQEPEPEEEPESEEEEEQPEEEEQEEKPKKKSRNARYNQKIGEQAEKIASLERQLAQRSEPTARQLLSDPKFLSQLAQVKNTQEPTYPKVPERPKRPERPKGFNLQRAYDEPNSADAKYVIDREDYNDTLLDWQEDKERVEGEIRQIKTREYQEKQYLQEQEQIRANLENGIYEAARESKYVPEGKEREFAEAAIEWLGDKESLSADVLFKSYLLKNYKPPAPKKAPKKKKADLPPAPAKTTASKYPGWEEKEGYGPEDFHKDILGV
jgi:hypothetical protein